VLGPAFLGYGVATASWAEGVGMVGGGLAGSLHHKGLKLSDEDKRRIAGELADGRAAVGVPAHADQAAAVQQARRQPAVPARDQRAAAAFWAMMPAIAGAWSSWRKCLAGSTVMPGNPVAASRS